jgi:glutaminase
MNFEDAKKKAQQMAMYDIQKRFTGTPDEVLDDRVLESEHCWMFFRNRAFQHLIQPGQLDFAAYVVSKRGTSAYIADYRDDEAKLQSYLQEYSDYLERRGE